MNLDEGAEIKDSVQRLMRLYSLISETNMFWQTSWYVPAAILNHWSFGWKYDTERFENSGEQQQLFD